MCCERVVVELGSRGLGYGVGAVRISQADRENKILGHIIVHKDFTTGLM